MTRRVLGVAVLVVGLGIAGAAQAALIDRGGGLIYDNVLDITWLQDANYAKTSGVNSTGRMNWSAAPVWAANLSYYDSVRNQTLTGWRLPTALNQDGTGPCSGYNCTSSELGHMFYNNLGGNATESVLNTTGDTDQEIANMLLFGGSVDASNGFVTGSSIRSDAYWSVAGYAPDPVSVWSFVTDFGMQASFGASSLYDGYAWAVRDGDVGPAPIPVPAALPLFASALVGLGLLGRRARR